MVNVLITGDFAGTVTDGTSPVATGTVFSIDADDGSDLATTWSISTQATYGTATIIGTGASAEWTYVLDESDPVVDALEFGQPLSDFFVIQSTAFFLGFNVGSDTQTIDITIFGICFADGTLIRTPDGAVAVEELSAGQSVVTKDGGAQPVIWTGGRWYSPQDCVDDPSLKPVRISAGALGKGLPERDLVVSQQHRILVSGASVELHFDQPDVFVAAKHLCHVPGIDLFMPTEQFGYFHVLCAEHHVLLAEGAEAESMFLGDEALHALSSTDLADLISRMSVASDGALATALIKPTCRRVLREHEALLITEDLRAQGNRPRFSSTRRQPVLCVSNDTVERQTPSLLAQETPRTQRAANM